MCAIARSRVNDEGIPQSLPRGARMKDYSDKEAVQSRKKGLVSTVFVFLLSVLPCVLFPGESCAPWVGAME